MAAAPTTSDSGELAGFGYKQELDRSLGRFSSFAAGFSYISILTGMFELFAFGYGQAGPPLWWTWLVVFCGQMLVALCFAELAGQYPLAGSVYNWSKKVGGDFTAWMTGWIYVVGAFVTVAAVAVAWQVVLPQVTQQLRVRRRQGGRRPLLHAERRQERADPRRDPRRVRDDREHARRQGDGADQQLRRDRRADRRLAAVHPAAVPHPPRPAGDRPQPRPRQGAPVGVLRSPADRRDHERVRDVRLRHCGHARRGDQRPAPRRAAGAPARAGGRRVPRRRAAAARDDGREERRRTRTSAPSGCPTSSSRRSATRSATSS